MRTQDLDQLIKNLRTEPSDDLDRRIHALLRSAPVAGKVDRRLRPAAGCGPHAASLGGSRARKLGAYLAIAAVAMVGVVLLAGYLADRGEDEPTRSYVDEAPTVKPPVDPHAELLRRELALADELFERRDVRALVSLLEAGRPETNARVVEYLGRIGDTSIISDLQQLAEQWQGRPQDNPYQAAVEAIKSQSPSPSPPSAADRVEPNLMPAPKPAVVAEAPWSFQPAGVLSGVVTDARTGEPVVGAEVTLVGNPCHDRTDEHGSYSIDAVKNSGKYKVRIHSRLYLGLGEWSELPVVGLSTETQTVRHFQLEPGCAVEVDVVDERGAPVGEVHLVASRLGAERGRQTDLGSDKTDPNGHAVVGALKPSDVAYRITARHDDYAPEHVDLTLNDPNVIASTRLVLKEGVDVQGFAHYGDGLPAKGIRLSAQPQWWLSGYLPEYYPTDDEGMFTLRHVAAGTYSIYVSIGDGFTSAVSQVRLPLPEGELLTVALPGKSPQSLVSISGRILWASAQRPTYLEVSVHNRATGTRRFAALPRDAETFEIGSLEPGTYTLSFKGHALKSKTIEGVEAPSSNLEVVLEHEPRPHLSGTVIAADTAEPVDRFRVRVLKRKTLRGDNTVPQAAWSQCIDGRFDVTTVGPGLYQVQVVAGGYAPALSAEINTDENAPVVVELSAGGRVEGLVTDAAGTPVSEATVIPLSTGSGNMLANIETFATTDGSVMTTDGRFVFKHLPPGMEAFKVTHPDYTAAFARDIEVIQGHTNSDVCIVLSRGGSVEGYVYDPQGRPQAGQTLSVEDDAGFISRGHVKAARVGLGVTDANGYYRIDRLPTGRLCYVMRRDSSSVSGVVRRVCIPAEEQTIRLDFGGRPAISGVIYENGLPRSNAKVQVSTQRGTYSKVFRCLDVTDADGRFAIRGVPPGRYGLHYERLEDDGRWALLATVEMGGQDVDLGLVEVRTTSVEVTTTSADPAVDPSAWAVHLREGPEFWGRRVGRMEDAPSTGPTRVISGIVPGTYQIVASQGPVSVRKPVRVESAFEPVAVELTIPAGTASVSGRFITDSDQPLILWNANKTMTAHVAPAKGTYSIVGLPAGHYTLGKYFLTDRAPVQEFDLPDGQAKTVDIDLRNWSPDLAVLTLFVVSDEGVLLTHAQVWLEGPTGRHDPEPAGSDGGYGFIVPSGRYTLVIRCQGYQGVAEPVILPRADLAGDRHLDYQVVRLEP